MSIWQSLTPSVGYVLGIVGHALAPQHCANCDAPVRSPLFCTECMLSFRQEVRFQPDDFNVVGVPVVSVGWYRSPLSDSIRKLKYRGRSDLARRLGALWRELPSSSIATANGCIVAPVPIHPARLVERGFNQSALLARPFAARVGGEVVVDLLQRTRDTGAQATLRRAQRTQNILGAVVVAKPDLACRRVVLVDDVVTTGSTLLACITALRNAGFSVPLACTLARTSKQEAC